MNAFASRLDVLLADPSTGLNASLQNFFNAVQDVNNDPASIPARQALLGRPKAWCSVFTGSTGGSRRRSRR